MGKFREKGFCPQEPRRGLDSNSTDVGVDLGQAGAEVGEQPKLLLGS